MKTITKKQQDYLHKLGVKARTLRKIQYRYARNNPMKPEDIFQHFDDKEGDFHYDDMEAGDWHVYNCGESDCPTGWHQVAYYEEIGRKNGMLFIDIGSVDESGNSDLNSGWWQGEDFSEMSFEMLTRSTDFFYGWFDYYSCCANNPDEDVVDVYFNYGERTVEDYIKLVEDDYKYLKMGTRI